MSSILIIGAIMVAFVVGIFVGIVIYAVVELGEIDFSKPHNDYD